MITYFGEKCSRTTSTIDTCWKIHLVWSPFPISSEYHNKALDEVLRAAEITSFSPQQFTKYVSLYLYAIHHCNC